jgi:hypothetical protein
VLVVLVVLEVSAEGIAVLGQVLTVVPRSRTFTT